MRIAHAATALLGALLILTHGLAPAWAQTDAYPLGSAAFFNLSACPQGWAPLPAPSPAPTGTAISGVLLIPFFKAPQTPLTPADLNKMVGGPPLADGEDRLHTHAFQSSITLASKGYDGASGSSNKGTSKDGVMYFNGVTNPTSSGLPYVQLLACQKAIYHSTPNPPIGMPQEVLIFQTTLACATGWKPSPLTNGRIIVGLPASGAVPQTPFGGDPLAIGEDRVHTHTFIGSVTLPSQGVELAEGGWTTGYGGAGAVSYAGTTAPSSTGLPYLTVTQCTPCFPNDPDPSCSASPRALGR